MLPRFLAFPRREGGGLVVVDCNGEVPMHIHFVEKEAQLEAVQALWPVPHPERRPLGIAECAPAPPSFGPVLLVGIAAIGDELEKFAVGGLELGTLERRYIIRTTAILVVPVFADAKRKYEVSGHMKKVGK